MEASCSQFISTLADYSRAGFLSISIHTRPDFMAHEDEFCAHIFC